MTEEEKRTLVLSFMKQEQSRFRNSHGALDTVSASITASLAHNAKVKEALSSLVQQGITWNELRDAYHTLNEGHQAMMTFKLSFFTLERRLPSMRDSV